MRGLRRIRKLRGRTQAWLSEQLNVSKRTIQRWEAGATFPGHFLDTIACILECNSTELVSAHPVPVSGFAPTQPPSQKAV